MKKLPLLAALFLLPGACAGADAAVHRVDPPSWWVGFKQTELQLMLYGDALKGMSVEVAAEGVAVDRVVATDNPDYLFVYLRISERARPGLITLQLTGRDGKVELPYRLAQKSTDPNHARGFSGADVIYLITPDRFANGDPENDLGDGGDRVNRRDRLARHGGDLKGIIDRLDYISALGFTAIWMNPVLENAMPRHSYHGYAVTDLYRVDPRFGDNEDYRRLAEEARKRGIGIIMDVIPNHIGREHPWLQSLPHADWLNAGGEGLTTNHAHTAVQDPYAAPEDLRRLVDGWFVDAMPDLNQRNPLLADYLIQHSLWWIEELGLAGFRTDTWPYADKHFLARWSRALLAEYPRFNMVGEEWHINPAILSYWQAGKVNHDGYVSGLPTLMDFPLQAALMKALTETPSWGSPWRPLYELLGTDFLYPNPGGLVVFGDNHDMDRLYTQLGEDYALFRLVLASLATIRGIPKLYYGTEILMANQLPGDHGDIRSDFPGGWPGDRVNGFTGEGLSRRQKEAREFVRLLLNWRKNKQVIHNGNFMHLHPEGEVHAYFRYNEEDAVAVFLNRGEAAEKVEVDRFRWLLDTYGSRWRNVLDGKTVNIRSSVRVPAKAPLILEAVERE